jgi:hypothetical protein
VCLGCAKSLMPNHGACPGGGAPGAGLTCCNMRLRFRQHKRVAMGKSDIAGWGSFLMVWGRPRPALPMAVSDQ